MGQAKARGTYEERKAKAIARDHDLWIKRGELLAEIKKNKTPEQKERDRKAQLVYSNMLAFASPYLQYFRGLR